MRQIETSIAHKKKVETRRNTRGGKTLRINLIRGDSLKGGRQLCGIDVYSEIRVTEVVIVIEYCKEDGRRRKGREREAVSEGEA